MHGVRGGSRPNSMASASPQPSVVSSSAAAIEEQDSLIQQLERERQLRAEKQAATEAIDAKLHKLYYKYELKLNDTQLRCLRARRRAGEFDARRMKEEAKADRLRREEEEEQNVAASMIQARYRGNKARQRQQDTDCAAAADAAPATSEDEQLEGHDFEAKQSPPAET